MLFFWLVTGKFYCIEEGNNNCNAIWTEKRSWGYKRIIPSTQNSQISPQRQQKGEFFNLYEPLQSTSYDPYFTHKSATSFAGRRMCRNSTFVDKENIWFHLERDGTVHSLEAQETTLKESLSNIKTSWNDDAYNHKASKTAKISASLDYLTPMNLESKTQPSKITKNPTNASWTWFSSTHHIHIKFQGTKSGKWKISTTNKTIR